MFITRLDEYTGLWSNIDVTVASSSIGQLLQWETDNDLYSSDHLPIYVHIVRDGYVPPSPNFCGWHINKANWTDFAAKCALIFSEREGMGNYKSITDALLRAAAECIPQKSGHSKYSCPWWNNECREAIRSRRPAQNRGRRRHRHRPRPHTPHSPSLRLCFWASGCSGVHLNRPALPGAPAPSLRGQQRRGQRPPGYGLRGGESVPDRLSRSHSRGPRRRRRPTDSPQTCGVKAGGAAAADPNRRPRVSSTGGSTATPFSRPHLRLSFL